jgi:nucleoid DNA-binding protein
LNPLKRKEISKLAAEKLGRNVSEVDEIVGFFYNQVQKQLGSLQNIAVNVPNLGTFVLKKKRVLKKLEKYSNYLAKLDKAGSLNAFEKRMVVKKDIESFETALQIMEQEEQRRQQVQILKEKHHADQDL